MSTHASDEETVETSGEARKKLTDPLATAVVVPPPDVLLEGMLVDNYRITALLGKGGFGAVYKAEDIRLKRPVALKFLHNPLLREHQHLFEREAKAIAALSKHPSIIQIHAWGEHAGRNYFVLEFVESSVLNLLEASPAGLAPLLAVRIVAECADGLAFAHKQGILHRDVKPANILIERDGSCPKLADFGLARLYERNPEFSVSDAVCGSPQYMSPEQATGTDLDKRSDIYSLGATLYELLCGKKSVEGTSTLEILGRVQAGKIVPLQARRADLPSFLVDIVGKAMALEPAKRYQSADEFAVALREAAQRLADPARYPEGKQQPVRRLGRRLRWAVVILAGVLAGTSAFLYLDARKKMGIQNVALAEAKERLDRGDAQNAEELYQTYLQGHPKDNSALYGLGFAQIRQGKVADADTSFNQITEKPLQSEGKAAVAYEQDGQKARAKIEEAQSVAATPYPKTLLARLDVATAAYREAAERLKATDVSRFNFEWQKAEYLRTLGQALLHTGDYADAQHVFEDLAKSSVPGATSFADAYLEIARSKADEGRKAAVSSKIQEVKKLLQEAQTNPQAARVDPWKSRPLAFCLMPPTTGKSRLAVESGLADVLPAILGKALTDSTPMRMVDRELLEQVLAEQELAAQLGSASGRLRLGQVLGARLLIECDFENLFRKDYLITKIVDTETTAGITPDRLDVPRSLEPDPWVKQAASRIWEAISKAYPIQGKIVKGPDGLAADVGASVGVRPGTRFKLTSQPDLKYILPNRSVVVEALVGTDSATVKAEGFKLEEVPTEGWYITEESVVATEGTR